MELQTILKVLDGNGSQDYVYDYASEYGEPGYTSRGAQYVPVWRVHASEGRTLDYCAAAWQSGATGPRIIRASVPIYAGTDYEAF